MTERAINMKARKYMELKAEIDTLQEQLEKLKLQIQEEMGEEEELTTNQFTILWPVINGSKFDTKGFKEKYPDLYLIYNKENPYRKFSIKEKKGV